MYCRGRSHTQQVPPCFTTPTWRNVSLEHFVNCPTNLAVNRQTRMLADLDTVGCYDSALLNTTSFKKSLLDSAKENLLKFSFFGITDEIVKTQFLFENTFNFRFSRQARQKLDKSELVNQDVGQGLKVKVRELTQLDEELYRFAKHIFLSRVRDMEVLKNYTVGEYFKRVRDRQSG